MGAQCIVILPNIFVYNKLMKISIIVTSYNYSNFIEQTINSILAQTYTNFELIIVDDCSSDNSVEIIKNFKDDRIKFIQNEQNLGLAISIAKALKIATGEWIAFCESDDFWEKDCLEKRIQIVEKYPNLGVIFNDVEPFSTTNKIPETIQQNSENLKKINFPTNVFGKIAFYNIVQTFSAVMISRAEIAKLNLTPPDDRFLDWWLFIQLASDTDFYYIPEKLTHWRLHENSYITKKKRKFTISANIQTLFYLLKTKKKPIFAIFLVLTTFLFILKNLKKFLFSQNL